MDLSNPGDWAGPYEYSRPNSNTPILVPFSFSSEVIALNVKTSASKPTWVTGGWLSQVIGIDLDERSVWTTFSQRIKLGSSIVAFPVNYSSYQLQFSFPSWFTDGTVSIYTYKGASDSQTLQLNLDNILTGLNIIKALLNIANP